MPDISLNTKYIFVFKNSRKKIQIVHLAREFYPEKISSFHKTYLEVCKDQHTYLFLDLKQSNKYLSRWREKIFPGETTEVFAPVRGNELVEDAAKLPSLTQRRKSPSKTGVTGICRRRLNKSYCRVCDKYAKWKS